jgi:ubiquinone biosynthesis protein UbiJ
MSSTDLAALDQRIASLEQGATYDATRSAVQQVQWDCLQQLRTIRESLTSSNNATASSAELKALQEENAKLKARNAKLEYRVQHMVHSMEGLYAKQK